MAARIVRSRAPDWITPASDRIIYDVGGAFDPAAGIFVFGSPLVDQAIINVSEGRHFIIKANNNNAITICTKRLA